jgi:hypothetical protein
MRGLSETALRAMFSSETDEAVILLLTIYDPKDNETEVLHLADNFTQRLSEYTTDTDVVYGVSMAGGSNSLGSVSVQSSDLNGTTSTLDSYFKVNGTKVNYTFTRGHSVMVLNPTTFAVETIQTYDTYASGISGNNSQSLLQALQAIPTGKLVCIGSWDATSLDQATRNYINQQFKTTRTTTWNASRTTHTVIGVKGNPYVKPIEVVTAGSGGFLSQFTLNSGYNTNSGTIITNSSFIYFPMEITLPSETDDGNSNCTIAINFASKDLIEFIRTNLTSPAKILLQLVLSDNPSYVEASFSNFYITGVTYNAQGVNLELSMINYSTEPFPAYNFSPKYFPGLF